MAAIATLTLNPAVDVSTTVERLAPTHKLRCAPARRDAGGGGVNVARVAHRLGGDVVAVFPAGGGAGAWLTGAVVAEGVDVRAVPIAAETRENFTVAERASGEQYRFVLPGPQLSPAELRACLTELGRLPGRLSIVVASGSLPPGAPADTYARVAAAAAAAGARFALDSHGPALRRALGKRLWLIKPSLSELRELTGAPLEAEADQIRACQALIARRQVEMVALTLGDRGAMLVSGQAIWRAPALPIKPLSTIGAGDCFLGGLVAALAAGEAVEAALARAVAAGSAALLRPGTDLCHARDVARLTSRVRVERLDVGSTRCAPKARRRPASGLALRGSTRVEAGSGAG